VTWLPTVPDGATPLARVFGLRPAAWARFRDVYAALWDGADAGVLDLCRRRIATLLACDVSVDGAPPVRASDAQVAALARWPTSPLFTAAERAAIGFAEQYVFDPHGLTDDDFATLGRHFDPPALARLALGVAVFDALARFRLALGVADDVS
jgi:alkylhydroperoxidase family enzyme